MRIREIKKNKPSKPRDPNFKAMQDLRSSGASGSHGDKTKEIPRKEKHKGKAYDINNETATPGATSAGNIATVANPHIANSKAKPKKQKPTDNALDNKSHDEASKVEQDHEVQMARAQLYKIAKYSIKLHEMLKNVSEQEGLEGWVQSKITKASDYIGAVYHNMDYEQKFEQVSENINEAKACNCNEDCACGGNCTPDCNCGPKCNEAVAETKESDYKESLADKLEAEKSEYVYEKQKGVDGKVCWKGYKRMGTKKKGGKTVDNCVKM